MCELFAVSAKRKIYLNEYLTVFREHSHSHPHGWGVAFFEGKNVRIQKDPAPAYESLAYGELLADSIEESTFIAHIRLATVGSLTFENCHPFRGVDESNRTWTVAHNGTIFKSPFMDRYKDLQTGTTDSERVMLHIIKSANDLLHSDVDMTDSHTRFEMMDRIILETAEHNKLNLLVYDGELLYIHTNMASTLYHKNLDDGILFATFPLDESQWTPLPMMQLFAYKDGALMFSGTKHKFEYFLNS